MGGGGGRVRAMFLFPGNMCKYSAWGGGGGQSKGYVLISWEHVKILSMGGQSKGYVLISWEHVKILSMGGAE